jgi:hypothetical protein
MIDLGNGCLIEVEDFARLVKMGIYVSDSDVVTCNEADGRACDDGTDAGWFDRVPDPVHPDGWRVSGRRRTVGDLLAGLMWQQAGQHPEVVELEGTAMDALRELVEHARDYGVTDDQLRAAMEEAIAPADSVTTE